MLHQPQPRRPHRGADRWGAHAVRRAGRPGRRRSARHAAPRHGVHGRARHERARRLHHAQPHRGRDEPRLRRRDRASGRARRSHQVERHRAQLDRAAPTTKRSSITDAGIPEAARRTLEEHVGQRRGSPIRSSSIETPLPDAEGASDGHRYVRRLPAARIPGRSRPAVDAARPRDRRRRVPRARRPVGLRQVHDAADARRARADRRRQRSSSATATSPTLPPKDRDIAMVFQTTRSTRT